MSDNNKAFYPAGHHESVLKAHRARTAANSAPFLLPLLRPTDTLLDVGCGPGSISCTLAQHVAKVTGIEHESAGEATLEGARLLAKDLDVADRVSFHFADALALPFEDNSFDVVYCHQVLQHVPDPVGVLREMRRVSKRLVAAREADRGSFVHYPDPDGLLSRFDELWYAVSRAGRGEPDAARRLKSWALEAGFGKDEVDVQAGSTRPDVKEWGTGFAERTTKSGFASKVLELGLSSQDELERISQAWREWAEKDDAWVGYIQGDLLAYKEKQ
ncbi:hypothetical protein JCM8097_003810 [Rhodosporidiobolus ruineniae]